jgi:tetratricopeptide (TPR) repeat protein
MDCRKILALALGLLGGVAGCQHQQGSTAVADARPAPDGNVIHKEAELPRRQPRPMTCVAYGDFRVKEAAAPERTPLERQQHYEVARKAYQQALELDPKCLAAHQGLARLYVAMEDHSHAVAAYRRALQLYPHEAGLWFELGVCYSHKQEWSDALESLSRATQLDPEDRRFADTLAVVLAAAGRYEESLQAFSRFNQEATAHYKLACTLRRLQQPDLCRRQLELALEKDPQLAPAQTLLAELGGQAAAPVQPASYVEAGPDRGQPKLSPAALNVPTGK